MAQSLISAPQPEAVEAGARVLKQGGNAIDAAITCALVQGVVDPQMCGVAGFGSLQLYMPNDGHHYNIDFHGKAPGAVKDDMWQHLIEGEAPDGFGFVLKGQVNDVGYQSVTIPGSLKAYFQAQTQHGTMDWADIVQPAIEWARRGSMVRPQMMHFWNVEDGFWPSGHNNNRGECQFAQISRDIKSELCSTVHTANASSGKNLNPGSLRCDHCSSHGGSAAFAIGHNKGHICTRQFCDIACLRQIC